MRKYCLALPVILLLLTIQLYALNDSTNLKFGVYGGINLNSHKADFYKLEGIPNCCPSFESGTGIGYNFGLLFEHKLVSDFRLGARLGLMTLNGDLLRNEKTTIIIESGPTEGVFEHKLTGSFLNLGFEPTIIYNPFGGLLISAGLRLGYNFTNDYSQIETITSPAGVGTFIDSLGNDTHLRTRNKFSGEIPNAIPFQMAVLGGISYEFPLNKAGSFLLVPEISYYYPLTELVKNTGWKVSSIKAGIALKYSPVSKPPRIEIFKKERIIDTVRIQTDIIAGAEFVIGEEKISLQKNETDTEIITTETTLRTDTLFIKKVYKLEGSITAVGVDNAGLEVPNPVFKIEEFISNRLDPLLNYIFFENNSSELPGKYISIRSTEAGKFEVDSLYRETTLDIYYNILNIIGKRLNENQTANITIVGCNSDFNEEKGNLPLSQKRAETIRDYLVNIWNIGQDRIKIEKRNLPQKASTPKDELDKSAENRRVEIFSDNDKILEPLFIKNITRTANPPIVRFKPKAESTAGLKNWTINAYQNSDKSNKFTISGNDILRSGIDWELAKLQKLIPKTPEPITYSLVLEDVKGNRKTIDNQTLPIDVITIQRKIAQQVGNYEIDKYSLILFDFDKSAIEGRNKNITDFIRARIKPESTIEISGYTDRTGDDAYNQKLSERRALESKNSLKRQDANAIGIGEEKLLYNNDIPEGRFYCRTVEITVKTPIK